MEAFGQRFATAGSINLKVLSNWRDITVDVQRHLQLVYLTLCGAILSCAVGAYAHLLWNLGGTLSLLATLGCMIWLGVTPDTPPNKQQRMGLLLGAAFFNGASIGPLIAAVAMIDPRIIVTAFLGTCVVFACFSGAALFSRRRSFLYLGGMLSSAISLFMMMRFASLIFGGAVAVFNAELYLGLLVFCGYVLYDTQVIVEKASRGQKDVIMHALDLFVDFVAIFVRLLIILQLQRHLAPLNCDTGIPLLWNRGAWLLITKVKEKLKQANPDALPLGSTRSTMCTMCKKLNFFKEWECV
eukprot:jgi/Mesvir1/15580/Mv03199-RA.1